MRPTPHGMVLDISLADPDVVDLVYPYRILLGGFSMTMFPIAPSLASVPAPLLPHSLRPQGLVTSSNSNGVTNDASPAARPSQPYPHPAAPQPLPPSLELSLARMAFTGSAMPFARIDRFVDLYINYYDASRVKGVDWIAGGGESGGSHASNGDIGLGGSSSDSAGRESDAGSSLMVQPSGTGASAQQQYHNRRRRSSLPLPPGPIKFMERIWDMRDLNAGPAAEIIRLLQSEMMGVVVKYLVSPEHRLRLSNIVTVDIRRAPHVASADDDVTTSSASAASSGTGAVTGGGAARGGRLVRVRPPSFTFSPPMLHPASLPTAASASIPPQRPDEVAVPSWVPVEVYPWLPTGPGSEVVLTISHSREARRKAVAAAPAAAAPAAAV